MYPCKEHYGIQATLKMSVRKAESMNQTPEAVLAFMLRPTTFGSLTFVEEVVKRMGPMVDQRAGPGQVGGSPSSPLSSDCPAHCSHSWRDFKAQP